MDILSDVLRVIRLNGALFFTAQFSAPWSLASMSSRELAPLLQKRAECIAPFHILVDGECSFAVDGQPAVRVRSGSVVVLPHGDNHVMSSEPQLQPLPIEKIMPEAAPDEIPHVVHGGGGAAVRFICGYLNCDQRFNPLIGALPKLLVVRTRSDFSPDGETENLYSHPPGTSPDAESWLRLMLRRAYDEADAKQAGSPAMLSRLIELLYLEVLRGYMQQLPEGEGGWLAGIRDPEVGRALRLLHENPKRRWTNDELGDAVGVSRSALTQRFRMVIGEPPMRYLTSWRMQLAKHLMRQPALSLPEIAAEVGYTSDVAFYRAFKRHVGIPPAAWRREFA